MWITVVQVQIISSINYSDYLHVDIVFIPFCIFFFLLSSNRYKLQWIRKEFVIVLYVLEARQA